MSMEAASITQHCQTLRLGAIGAQFAALAEEARQQNHSHLHYLEALLQAEVEERERRSIELRLKDAHLPRMKTLEEFDFAQSPHIPASRLRALAEGGYLERSEPVLLVGEPGTGKTHLATGLAIAACRQRKRVRFTTAAALVNQLVEAQREQGLSRMLARWSRVELIVIDELGYVPLAEVAAELLFQVIAERAEKAAIIVTTNLPFSEWPSLKRLIVGRIRANQVGHGTRQDVAENAEPGSKYRFRLKLPRDRCSRLQNGQRCRREQIAEMSLDGGIQRLIDVMRNGTERAAKAGDLIMRIQRIGVEGIAQTERPGQGTSHFPGVLRVDIEIEKVERFICTRRESLRRGVRYSIDELQQRRVGHGGNRAFSEVVVVQAEDSGVRAKP